MVSTAGLEPARVSPHAPQTCAYTDSATSTYLVFNLCRVYLTSHRRYLIVCSAECHVDMSWIIVSRLCVALLVLQWQNCRSLLRRYFEFRDFITHSTQNPLHKICSIISFVISVKLLSFANISIWFIN